MWRDDERFWSVFPLATFHAAAKRHEVSGIEELALIIVVDDNFATNYSA
jgi:hypothetical protein